MGQPPDGAEQPPLRVSDPATRGVPDASASNSDGDGPTREAGARSRSGASATVVRTWRFVIVGAVVGALIGAGVASVVPERYEASAYLVVTADEDADAGTTPTAYAQVYSRIARQPAVMMEADPEAELGTFGQGITVTSFPDAPVIEMSGIGDSAEQATLRANAMADALAVYSEGEAAVSGYTVEVVTPALEEGATRPPTMLPSLSAGLVLGVFAGFVLAMLTSRRGRRR